MPGGPGIDAGGSCIKGSLVRDFLVYTERNQREENNAATFSTKRNPLPGNA